MDHECIEQPVAVFYLISTDEPNIVQAAEKLQASSMLPDSFHQNVLTIERVPKIFLLLHEPKPGDTGKDELNKHIKDIERNYGGYAQILTINGGRRCLALEKFKEKPGVLADIWSPYLTKRSDA